MAKRISDDELYNLTIGKDGVKFLPPIFTPAQCDYIWNETEQFIQSHENNLEDKGVPKYNGYYTPNVKNHFTCIGLPAVAFLIIEEIAKIFSKCLNPVNPDIIQTDNLGLLCSIEGFDFQRPDDYISCQSIEHFRYKMTNKNTYAIDSKVVRCCIQITPGQQDGTCFSAFLKSDIDNPVLFDNKTILPGQLILFNEKIIHEKTILPKSRHLMFYVTCWQQYGLYYKSNINRLPHSLNWHLKDKIINNRLTSYNLHIQPLNNINHRTKKYYKSRDIYINNMIYSKHPKLDTMLLCSLFEIYNLSYLEQDHYSYVKTKPTTRYFKNVVSQSKSLPQVRQELYALADSICKRKLSDCIQTSEFDPPTKRLAIDDGSSTSTIEKQMTGDSSKKTTNGVSIDTLYESFDDDDDVSIDVSYKSFNDVISIDTEGNPLDDDIISIDTEDESFDDKILTSVSTINDQKFKTAKISCASFYIAILIIYKFTQSQLFVPLIKEMESKGFTLNEDANCHEPSTDLNSVYSMIRVENDCNIGKDMITITLYKDKPISPGRLDIQSYIIFDKSISVTNNDEIIEFFRDSRIPYFIDNKEQDALFYQSEIVIRGQFDKWKLENMNLVIHPKMDFSETEIYHAFRTFNNEYDQMFLMVYNKETLSKMNDILDDISFNNPHDPDYKPAFLIPEFLREYGSCLNYMNDDDRDTSSTPLDKYLRTHFTNRLVYYSFRYDCLVKNICGIINK